jgi:hypothetical protein
MICGPRGTLEPASSHANKNSRDLSGRAVARALSYGIVDDGDDGDHFGDGGGVAEWGEVCNACVMVTTTRPAEVPP